MSVVVSVLGLIAAAAGVAAFGFGLSVKEFSFGGTLMVTGMIALIGGLLLVAIGAAIRELHRIGTILASRQAPRVPRPGESPDLYPSGFVRPATSAPPMAPMAPAPMPLYGALADPADNDAGKMKPETVAVDLMQATPIQETARPDTGDVTGAETAVHETPGDGYKSPMPGVLPQQVTEPFASDVPPSVETTVASESVANEPEQVPLALYETPSGETPVTFDREVESAEEPTAKPETVAERHHTASDTAAAMLESEQPSAERERLSPFDAIWPSSERAPAHRSAEAETEALSIAPVGDDEEAHPPTSEAPNITPSDEPETVWSRDSAVAEPADVAPSEERPELPHAVSILKSGTVDGMGYALYSDGSIEAELPSGTIRFASINELREHLERTG